MARSRWLFAVVALLPVLPVGCASTRSDSGDPIAPTEAELVGSQVDGPVEDAGEASNVLCDSHRNGEVVTLVDGG